MRKRKKRKPSWMDNRAHKAQKTKVTANRKGNHLNREDYNKALNIFTREARRSKGKF